MPQPLPNGPPGVHPALAQCNTSMPKQGDPWLCTLEVGEKSQDSILPKATHTFKNNVNTDANMTLKYNIFKPKPTTVHNKFDVLPVTDELYFCEVAQVEKNEQTERWNRRRINEENKGKSNAAYWKFKKEAKNKVNDIRNIRSKNLIS